MSQKQVEACQKGNTIEVTVTIDPPGYDATSAVVTAVPPGGGGVLGSVMDVNSTKTTAKFIIGPVGPGSYTVSVVCSDRVFGGTVPVSVLGTESECVPLLERFVLTATAPEAQATWRSAGGSAGSASGGA
jgi:hypothetical protein